jgi:hypothetical protein
MSELYAVNRLIAEPPSETETLRREPVKPRRLGWPHIAFTWNVDDDQEEPLVVAVDGRIS